MKRVSSEKTDIKEKKLYDIVRYDARLNPKVIARNFSKETFDGYAERYCVVSTETGEILDDADGWGYTTPDKAKSGYSYKCSEASKQQRDAKIKKRIKKWISENPKFAQAMTEISFKIDIGVYGPDAVFNEAVVKEMLKGIRPEPNFTAGELLEYWTRLK